MGTRKVRRRLGWKGRRGKKEREENIEKKGRTEGMEEVRIYRKLKDNCIGT